MYKTCLLACFATCYLLADVWLYVVETKTKKKHKEQQKEGKTLIPNNNGK